MASQVMEGHLARFAHLTSLLRISADSWHLKYSPNFRLTNEQIALRLWWLESTYAKHEAYGIAEYRTPLYHQVLSEKSEVVTCSRDRETEHKQLPQRDGILKDLANKRY